MIEGVLLWLNRFAKWGISLGRLRIIAFRNTRAPSWRKGYRRVERKGCRRCLEDDHPDKGSKFTVQRRDSSAVPHDASRRR